MGLTRSGPPAALALRSAFLPIECERQLPAQFADQRVEPGFHGPTGSDRAALRGLLETLSVRQKRVSEMVINGS